MGGARFVTIRGVQIGWFKTANLWHKAHFFDRENFFIQFPDVSHPFLKPDVDASMYIFKNGGKKNENK